MVHKCIWLWIIEMILIGIELSIRVKARILIGVARSDNDDQVSLSIQDIDRDVQLSMALQFDGGAPNSYPAITITGWNPAILNLEEVIGIAAGGAVAVMVMTTIVVVCCFKIPCRCRCAKRRSNVARITKNGSKVSSVPEVPQQTNIEIYSLQKDDTYRTSSRSRIKPTNDRPPTKSRALLNEPIDFSQGYPWNRDEHANPPKSLYTGGASLNLFVNSRPNSATDTKFNDSKIVEI
ncbi:uncharacterized protein LOC141911605 [Tubulanus polymorphus]|uniref:uncharacterized protein LOC141911605 n=1 Tax=Tubulanus polymorphus TaxID=672921 RepID=UPI003DA5A369